MEPTSKHWSDLHDLLADTPNDERVIRFLKSAVLILLAEKRVEAAKREIAEAMMAEHNEDLINGN